MKLILHLFLNHLPLVEEETRFVNGEEQVCLIIPTKINQLKKGKQGNWLMAMILNEEPPNAKQITHSVCLTYLNWDEVDKARAQGYYARTRHMGRVHAYDRTPSKKVDRTNRASDLKCEGVLTLNDIPRRYIKPNGLNGKRYVENLALKSLSDPNVYYTGSICLDDIPDEYIQVDPGTGKRRVKLFFTKTQYLDTYMNTHQLVIVTPEGFELEIGRFREWKKVDGKDEAEQPEERSDEEDPGGVDDRRELPESIDGIRF